MDKIVALYNKYKEIINYIIFGALTTLVNFFVYFICIDMFSIHYLIANIIAWILSVIFAYISNRLFVFEKVNFSIKSIFREITLFFGARLLSGLIETGALFIMVSLLAISDKISKLLVAVIVVILNYIFSKLIVFKKYR